MEKKYAEYLLKKTQKDYNLIAEDFSKTRARIWDEIRFLFDNYLIEGDRVLDLGCGNGRYYETVKGKRVDYIGVDNSERLIKLAQRKNPGVKFQTADAFNLPFSNNYFDKVYSIAVLHHMPSKKFRSQFLKEAKRVLKQRGLLILTVWKFYGKKKVFLSFKYTILKLIGKSKLDFKDIFEPWGKKTERYYHWFSKRELANLVKREGFKIKEVDIIKKETGKRRNIYLIAEK